MKITMVFSNITFNGFDSFKRDSFIHHGIASIVSYLKKNKYEVDYIDLRFLTSWADFRKLIRKNKSDVFGLSSTTVDFGEAIKVARIIRKIHPKSKIVIGGVHATVCPEDALKIKEFDYVVKGEGELAMLELVKQIGKRIKGKRLIQGKPCPLEDIPHIDRDLFKHRLGEMAHPMVEHLEPPFATIISSRGCPYACAFCQPAERMIFEGKVRNRSNKDVVEEIKEISVKYGLKSFLIHDDLFTVNRDRMEEFIKFYKASGVKAEFMCQARADLIIKYQDVFKKLKEVGLSCVMVGFESGNQRILNFIKKSTTVAQNVEAAKICKELGIKIWANYMLGLPSETYGEMRDTLRMVRKMKPEYYSPALFTPYPATDLYTYCEKRDLLIFKHYSEYKRGLIGDKIKGINYHVIRFMIFWYMPWHLKWYLYYFLISLWGKHS